MSKRYRVQAVTSIDFEIDVYADSEEDALQIVSEMDYGETRSQLSDAGFQGVPAFEAEER